MEHQHFFYHPCLDFSKYLCSDDSNKLILWGCLNKIGFIRGLSERYFLTELKKFLTSPAGQKITHFNFEKNFYSLAINQEKNFDLFVDMLADNNSIKVLEIGNNYIPINLIEKLVKTLSNKSALTELSVRMHWPGFKESNQNLPFITHLTKELPHLLGLEKLDLSGNHLNEECLIALANACESSVYLLEVNLSDVTYMGMRPDNVYNYWLRINNALIKNQDLIKAIMAMPETQAPEKPKLLKRKLIVSSDDEQSPQLPKSFTARLEAIGFDIATDNSLGVKTIELFYYEEIGNKVYRKFMEDPHALFYYYKGNTYHYNYDGNYIKEWLKTKKWDPYSQRNFNECFVAPNPFKKIEIHKLIEDLERDYRSRSVYRYL